MKRKTYERNRRFAPGYTRQPINKSKRKDNMIDITKEKFDEYVTVQRSGMFNMFDPRAREMTDLSRQQWLDIIKNYDELSKKYSEVYDD